MNPGVTHAKPEYTSDLRSSYPKQSTYLDLEKAVVLAKLKDAPVELSSLVNWLFIVNNVHN